MAGKLEQKGRKGDKLIAHLTPGEIVIPRAFAEDNEFRAIVAHFMKENGANLEEFIVGSGKNKINPETGYMEFGFFKKLGREIARPFKQVKKAIFPEVPKISTPPPLPPAPPPTVGEEVGTQARRRRPRGRRETFLTGDLIPVLEEEKTRSFG